MTSTLEEIEARLTQVGVENPKREASRILAILETGRTLDLEAVYSMRAQGTPLGFIVGTEVFLGVELLSDAGALSPREETELLGRTALDILKAKAQETGHPRVIDMCCGAGNLACSIAWHIPTAAIWASDLTDGCVSLSRRNAEHVGLTQRVEVRQGDLFSGLQGLGLEGTVDMVVCNPPYISTSRLDSGDRQQLVAHEPREAFDGGPYGVSVQTKVSKAALDFLRPGGWLLFEFGLGQEKQMASIFKRAMKYKTMETRCDAQGRPRVALAQVKDG